MKLIRSLKRLENQVSVCSGDAIDLQEASKLFSELESVLARIEIQNFSKKVGR
jgi:hypothetical protein